ncbi:MAG: stage II sporulation protein M [Dethiobacteria bacterium]|jgi:stage II sporulation protein M
MRILRHFIADEVVTYLRHNLGIYMFIILLLVVGVAIGAFAIRFMDKAQIMELDQFFSHFLYSLRESPLDQGAIFRQSLQNTLRYGGFVCILGILPIGFPLIAAVVFLKGFTLGFTVGFLLERFALRGLLFCLGAIFPHNIFILPAFLVVATAGFSFSFIRLQGYIKKRPQPLKENLGGYLLLSAAMAVVFIGGAIVESWITPVFMRLMLPLFLKHH